MEVKSIAGNLKIEYTRKWVTPKSTNEKNYGEVCSMDIHADNSKLMDLYIEYNSNFDNWLKSKLAKKNIT